MDHRLKNITNWMKRNQIDIMFLTSTENIFYLSGFYSDPHERLLGLAVFQEAEPFLICPGMEKNDAQKVISALDVLGYSDTDNPWMLVKKAILERTKTVNTMAIEKEHMNVERYETLHELFPKSKFISAEEKLREQRMIKDDSERKKILEACALADYAIQVGCSEIKEGKTELEILAAIEFELKKKGVERMSFSTMVLTGENGASPHGTPGQTMVQKGDLVLFDLGVVVDGYCSDITRTVAYGDINDKQREIYHTVLRAQLSALQFIKPGVTSQDVDLAARNVIREAGYGEFFPHRLGHGLGISVHEYPSLTETNPLVLQPGMIFTVEPGIYVPNVAGVRIEDDVFVTENGVEVLTKFPKDLQILS